MLAVKAGDSVRLVSRQRQDYTKEIAGVAHEVGALTTNECVLDGEVCALDAQGVPSFQLLQNRDDLRGLPIEERREKLQRVVAGVDRRGAIVVSTAAEGDPRAILAPACERGLEGIVAKRKGSTYASGRRPRHGEGRAVSPSREGLGTRRATAREDPRADQGGRIPRGRLRRRAHRPRPDGHPRDPHVELSLTRAFAQMLVREDPTRFVAVVAKHVRAGKILVDYLRNSRANTSDDVRDHAWDIRRVLDRFDAGAARQHEDPWAGYVAARQRLPRAPR